MKSKNVSLSRRLLRLRPWPRKCFTDADPNMATASAHEIGRNRLTISPAPILWARSGVLLLLIGVLYAQVLADLAHDWWTQPSLSYGLLIPPLCGYIVWLRREETLSLPLVPDNRGLYLIAFSCFLYSLGKFGAEYFFPRTSRSYCFWSGSSGLFGAARG